MKKLFFTGLMLTVLLAATVGTAFAGSALELFKVQNNRGGPTFTFRVNGEFSADELASGFVQVQGGDDFPLFCSQTADDTVVCHASRKVGAHDVVVGFGGARFWTNVPDAHISQVCTPVYDWTNPAITPPDHWVFQGNECSEDAPFEGQRIFFDPWTWTGPTLFPYLFRQDGDSSGYLGAPWAPAGPGYYYPNNT